MRRLLAGSAATLLFVTGALFIWQGRAEAPSMPAAPTPRLASAMAPINLARIPDAPSADPRNKEQKRFARALRPLTAFARLAARDVQQAPTLEPEATPARAAALLSHRLFGTIS